MLQSAKPRLPQLIAKDEQVQLHLFEILAPPCIAGRHEHSLPHGIHGFLGMLLRLFTNVDSVEKLTKSFVSKCEITPPARVADISRGQEFEDSEIFSVCIQCSTEIPCRGRYKSGMETEQKRNG